MAARESKTKPVAGKAAKRATAKPTRLPRRKPETLRLRSVTASLTVDDVDRSLDFYTRVLGFVIDEEWVHDGERIGALLRAGTCELGIGRDDWKLGEKRKKGQGVRLYLETAQDIDALAERVRAAGGRILDGPTRHDWGAYAIALDDPDGFHLTLYRRVPRRR